MEIHWVVSKVHISCVNWWAIIIILLIHMLWVKYFWRSHVSRVFHLVDFTVAYWVLALLTAVQVRIAPPTLLWYSPMLTLHITFSIMLLATLHLNVEPSCSYFMNVIMGDLPIKLHHTATHNNSRFSQLGSAVNWHDTPCLESSYTSYNILKWGANFVCTWN